MDRRLEGMPAVVVITAASFALFGGLLLFIAASDVMTRGSSDGMLIAYGFTTLVGVASTAISLGVAAGRWSARILGILGATLVMLAAAAGMLFTALMAGSVGIGWDDRLFLEPFSFLLVFAAAAVGCVVALVRSRGWFASRLATVSTRPTFRQSSRAASSSWWAFLWHRGDPCSCRKDLATVPTRAA